MTERKFYTVRGYQLLEKSEGLLTASLEDYMEMIYRKITTEGYIRVNELAKELNVKPSSVSKMISKLADMEFIVYQKYGVIKLTESGWKLGKYLLWRHNIVASFFALLSYNNPERGFMETERVEHLLCRETVMRLEKLVEYINQNKDNWDIESILNS